MLHPARTSKPILAGTATGGLPEAITATTSGVTIDLRGYEQATADVYVGTDAALDASNYWTLIAQHAHESTVTPDTAGTWEACADKDLLRYNLVTAADDFVPAVADDGSFALIDSTAEDAALFTVGYMGKRAYFRLRFVETGTLNTTFYAVVRKCASGNIPATR